MSNICQFSKTVSAEVGFDMLDLAKPLNTQFNISMFGYMKIYEDGSQVSVSTHPHWLKCMYENFYEVGAYSKSLNAHTEGYHLWSQLKNKSTLPIMSTDFKIAHGITLVKKNENSAEIFSFASEPENEGIITWYLNNIDILEAFIHSFKDRGQVLLKRAEADRLILPKCMTAGENEILFPISGSDQDTRKSFLEEIKINRLLINDLPKKTYLTRKELTCITMMMRGKTTKETAKLLNISSRTVESFINSSKLKMEVKNSAELIVKVIKLAPYLIV
jgi:DNA-binding CsgD family transcriptional regulator